jgi:predicted methyltransferase
MPDICSFLAMMARVLKRDGIVEHFVPVPDVEYHASNAPEKRED